MRVWHQMDKGYTTCEDSLDFFPYKSVVATHLSKGGSGLEVETISAADA